MISRLLPLFALALALGACSARAPTAARVSPRYASLDAALDDRTGPAVSVSDALGPERRASPVAVLPAWIGSPTALRERDDAEIFEQAIALGTPPRGETRGNRVTVTMPRSAAADRPADGTASRVDKPTEAGIRAEMDALFPGIAMQVVERPAANDYGPYGLAIGRGAGGARCLYAWQWIAEPPVLQAGQGGALPLSLRVRLCRSDITLEAMAAAVSRLRLVPRFSGEPLAQASSAPARPEAGSRRAARRARVAVQPAEPAEAPHDRRAEPTRAAPDLPGRRYLGAERAGSASSHPVAGAATGSGAVGFGAVRATLAGLGGPARTDMSGAISADLPPEAYLGPPAGKGR